MAAAHGRFSRILQVAPMCTPYTENQKWLPWQHPLEPRNGLCLHRIAWPRKPTPRIKLHVASYHTTKVIAHQTPKPVIANYVPKLVAMATTLTTYGPPCNTWFLRPIRAHNANGILIGSAVFAQTTVSLYFTMGRPFSPKNLPLPMGGSGPHLTHGSPGPPKSSTQKAARSVQPFLQGSLVWQTDRQPTDHATRSVRIGRIYVRSTAMRPNNKKAANSLGICLLQQRCPEFIPPFFVATEYETRNTIRLHSRQPVVNDHFSPNSEPPKVEVEHSCT